MKKVLKNTIYILVILMLLQVVLMPVSVKALTDPVSNPDTYIPKKPKGDTYDNILGSAGSILGTLQNIGIVVSVLSIMILGVKYIIGSVEEKAEYKKTMVPIVIGIILITSIITIINIIQTAVNSVFSK